METMILLLSLLLVTMIVIFGYYQLQIMKVNNKILERMNGLKAQTPNDSDNNLFSLDYGLQKNDEFPSVIVTDILAGTTYPYKLSDTRESLILITGIGCQPCEEALIRLSHYDSSQIEQNIVLLSFDPPQIVPESVREKHLMLVQKISGFQLVVGEKVLDDLKVNTFPTLIRVTPEGQVMGTYSGHYQSIVNHLQFRSKSLIS
ncbi:hypothetical protein ACE41H_20655 [Paenibacillus enshidis]|uniref:Thioredoxin domain-containing protein n=1 Tax=Paenibacillus enshidis TaxID=1458439 RepID=A0ABV5AZ64_9BACL